MSLTWIEAVLYSPEGNIINDPLYTFNFNEVGRNPSSGGQGGGEMPGNANEPVDSGNDENERDYPPVEPYERRDQYIGVKDSEGLTLKGVLRPCVVRSVVVQSLSVYFIVTVLGNES